jgi:hypothetical protein
MYHDQANRDEAHGLRRGVTVPGGLPIDRHTGARHLWYHRGKGVANLGAMQRVRARVQDGCDAPGRLTPGGYDCRRASRNCGGRRAFVLLVGVGSRKASACSTVQNR